MPASKTISQAKLEANRANAQRSTGPRTPDGKSRSSANSLKHGLRAKDVLLSTEDRADFEDLRAQLINEHQPVGTQELLLVTQIVDSYWRLRRARALETAALESEIGWHDSATEQLAMLNAWRAKADEIEKLRRYVASFERSYYRALAELRRTQAERRKSQPKPVSQPPRLLIDEDDAVEPVASPTPLTRRAGLPPACISPSSAGDSRS